jgi:hypothetical protein
MKHLRLPPLGVIDLIFFLAFRAERSRLNAYGITSVVLVLLSSGMLLSLSALLGIDLVGFFRDAYSVDILDIPQSPLKRSAGPAVLFCLPMTALLLLAFYRSQQVEAITNWYEKLPLRNSFAPGLLLFLGSMAGCIAVATLPPKLLAFPLQILLLTALTMATSIPGVVARRSPPSGEKL